MIVRKRLYASLCLLFICYNVRATVGGPLVVEVLGINQDSTKLYWTFQFQGESDDPFPVYIYSVETGKIEQRQHWTTDTDYGIEDDLAFWRRKFMLDTNNRVNFSDYTITYKDSGYVDDTINYLPYPLFSYEIRLGLDTITVWNCSHRDPAPSILRTYQLAKGVQVHICTFMGVPMEEVT